MSNRSTRCVPLAVFASLLMLATATACAQDGRVHQGRGNGNRPPLSGDTATPAPQPRQPQQPQRQQQPQRDDTLADSVRRIERSTRGQVLSAERVQSDGRDVNRIKVMDQRGRVRVYMDDPQQRDKPPTRDNDN